MSQLSMFVPRPKGRIHAARVENSPRLQRVLAALTDANGTKLSTRDLIERADVCAVNTAIDELRENGIDVRCECAERGRYVYWIPRTEETR